MDKQCTAIHSRFTNKHSSQRTMGKSTTYPQSYTTVIRSIIHIQKQLLTSNEYIFYPVSTAPIIKTTKGKLKER